MEEIPVPEIVRSRRRTIALIVTPEAKLVVRAPLKAPPAQIEDFVRKQHRWIRKKVAEMRERPQPVDYSYGEGEIFWYLGRPYPLHIVDDGGTPIRRTDRLCVSRSLMPDIRHRLRRWYRDEAEREIRGRCMWFSMKTGHVPASIRITDARHRWGSCTHRGGLNFSWRLIQAPPAIVDYVVVHELVHISQPDHSRKFWQKVREVLPDYGQRRDWLRENERLLRI